MSVRSSALLLLFFIFQIHSSAQRSDSLRGLQHDIFLHPVDGPTGYTLKKNEFILSNGPPNPLATWLWWGITDRITLNIDGEAILGGLIIAPHIPFINQNVRIRINDQRKLVPTTSVEIMYQHLWDTISMIDMEGLLIRKTGNNFYAHVNNSWRVKSKLYFHFSFGANYAQQILFSDNDSLTVNEHEYSSDLSPDLDMAIDYRAAPWLSMHLNASYGSTFTYIDNVPGKYQLSYGFRVAPFYKCKHGILKNFRIELAGLFLHFDEPGTNIPLLVPGYPAGYIYWQWSMRKK